MYVCRNVTYQTTFSRRLIRREYIFLNNTTGFCEDVMAVNCDTMCIIIVCEK